MTCLIKPLMPQSVYYHITTKTKKMKKLIVISAIMLGGLGIKNADAQFGIRVHLNLGTRPVYVPAPQPVEVDDQPVYNDDDYYYLPDVEAYYSVGDNCYYYQDGDRWISAAYLPGRYHDFDWRSARRFEIHANRPFMHHDVYRGRFGGYASRNDYYARAYPNRGGFDNRPDNRGGRDQYDNRGGWGGPGRGGYDNRHDDRNQGGYGQQPGRGQNQGGYNQQQPGRGQQGQGGYNQQPGRDQNQGGYNHQQQPGRGQQGQGGYNQNQGQQGGQQQGQQGGGRGNDQPSRGQGGQQGGGNNGQPTNHNGGGQDRGGDHFAANKMGVVNDHSVMSRPVRF